MTTSLRPRVVAIPVLLLAFLMLACVFALPAQAAYTEVNLDGSAPVKTGDYYLRCKNDVVQISTKKKSGYKNTPMAAWNVFTNGKKAYYIFTEGSTTSLYKYTFSTGKATAVKKLNTSGVYWGIGTIYKGNAYLTKNSEESWKMWTYRLNLSTKKNVKVASNCDIVSRSGAYVVGANEYATDVSPIKISLYKITSSGLKKIKVLTKNGRGATFVGKNVYYTEYSSGMNHASLYRCSRTGASKKRLGQFEKEGYWVALGEFSAKNCSAIFFSDDGSADLKRYRYTYDNMKLTPIK